MWSNRLQHCNTSSRIVLCSGSENTTPCCQNATREETKNLKYFQAYKALCALDDTHFEPFVVESGGGLGGNIQEDLQSYHPINGPKWIFYSILLEIKTSCHTCEDRTPMHSDGQWHITIQGIQTVYQSTLQTVTTTTLTRQGG